jgi:hypothetical protein
MKSPSLRLTALSSIVLSAVVLLAGCAGSPVSKIGSHVVLTNATAPTLPENPSGIYTFQVIARPNASSLIRESVRVNLTVDGQTFAMNQSPGSSLWEYDYPIARGRSEVTYFFTADYEIQDRNGLTVRRDTFTPLQALRIVNRFALALEANRAPVGAQIAVVGRGFEPTDVIRVGNIEAPTRFISPNNLQFTVPPLDAGQAHPVVLASRTAEFPVGSLRVDRSRLSVAPAVLNLRSGERRQVTFTIPSAAPPMGLILDVTTDVPLSVVMPEVVVPAGATSVTTTIIGGSAGSGSLFVEAPGFETITIPVTVN